MASSTPRRWRAGLLLPLLTRTTPKRSQSAASAPHDVVAKGADASAGGRVPLLLLLPPRPAAAKIADGSTAGVVVKAEPASRCVTDVDRGTAALIIMDSARASAARCPRRLASAAATMRAAVLDAAYASSASMASWPATVVAPPTKPAGW